MSLIQNVGGATEKLFSINTSFGEARFKLFHKTGAGTRRSVVFVSHGFQNYPARTEPDTYKTHCFAYLVPKNTSLSRTNFNTEWATEAARKFADQPLAFATAGIISAVVGAHNDPPEEGYNEVWQAMLEYCDVALFDGLALNGKKELERNDLQKSVGVLAKQIRLEKDPTAKGELTRQKQEVLTQLAFFDNDAIPLVEVVGHGTFALYSQYLMHCCRPAWPPKGGTTTGAAAKTPQGLYAYDDAFRAMID